MARRERKTMEEEEEEKKKPKSIVRILLKNSINEISNLI